MKDQIKGQLKAIRDVMETIEVHGRENIRRLLACINTTDALLESLENAPAADKEADQK